ncbi:MAG: hypothetical protein AABW64_00085 [Nanoarchaeota archaeon]
MKQRLESYRNLEKDLLKQIDLCNRYKQQIEVTLHDLQRLHNAGHIDQATHQQQVHHFLQGKHPYEWHAAYDQHIAKCHNTLSYCRQKITELTSLFDAKRNTFSKSFAVTAVLLAVFGVITFVQTPWTGLFSLDAKDFSIVAEDGATAEGLLWTNINGSQTYARCMEVVAPVAFNAVNIFGKITSAVDKKQLEFSLYSSNILKNEPEAKHASCRVSDYSSLWKSCLLKTDSLSAGNYWICASAEKGSPTETYYLLDYGFKSTRNTALWNGKNWQKLQGITYTIKAQFMKS